MLISEFELSNGNYTYHEDVNPDALDGDKWIENETSPIWKIGVIVLADSNKLDWASVFIAYEHEPGQQDFIGMLKWDGGENDFIGSSMKRAYELMKQRESVFQN